MFLKEGVFRRELGRVLFFGGNLEGVKGVCFLKEIGEGRRDFLKGRMRVVFWRKLRRGREF